MNIRKYWKKVLLSIATFFWAGCSGESNSTTPDISQIPDGDQDKKLIGDGGAIALYGVRPIYDPISGEISSSDKCDTDCETNSSSSIESNSSSSNAKVLGPYKLARDTSITCEIEKSYTGSCVSDDMGHYKINELLEKLEQNDTRSLEQLDEIETKLENTDCSNLLVETNCVSREQIDLFKCSNGSTYERKLFNPGKEDYYEVDGILYSYEEYKKKFSPSTPYPLCQKTNFIYGFDSSKLYEDTQAYIESIKKENSLTSEELACIDKAQHHNDSFTGILAKTQICDGVSTTNPRYQAFIKAPIDECMKKE